MVYHRILTIVLDLVDYKSSRCWGNQEWKEYIEEFYKTYLNELDNCDDVVTHPSLEVGSQVGLRKHCY